MSPFGSILSSWQYTSFNEWDLLSDGFLCPGRMYLEGSYWATFVPFGVPGSCFAFPQDKFLRLRPGALALTGILLLWRKLPHLELVMLSPKTQPKCWGALDNRAFWKVPVSVGFLYLLKNVCISCSTAVFSLTLFLTTNKNLKM